MQNTIRIIAVAFSCIAIGAILGAICNIVNGAVSPQYFQSNMPWHNISDIWRAAIAQGIFEGLIYGLMFTSLFSTVYTISTKGQCPYSQVFKFLAGIALVILICWALGGIIALALAALSPQFFSATFNKVPQELHLMHRYAWVGGSIWGIIFGGFLSAILGSIIFRHKWKTQNSKS